MKYLLMTLGTILTIAISSTLFACGGSSNGSAKNSVSFMGNNGNSIMLAAVTPPKKASAPKKS